MGRKRIVIDTNKQAVEYLNKVLKWKTFCKVHKPLAQALKVVLKDKTL